MQFFVNPKATTILYPWGEDADNKAYWVRVKDHLSTKEEKDVQAAGIPHMLQKAQAEGAQAEVAPADRETKVGLDIGRMSLVRATKAIVDWSLVDSDGARMPLSEASIGELLPEVFDAIDKALDAHKKAKADEKKLPSGTTLPKSA
jgi:hypothetical protein